MFAGVFPFGRRPASLLALASALGASLTAGVSPALARDPFGDDQTGTIATPVPTKATLGAPTQYAADSAADAPTAEPGQERTPIDFAADRVDYNDKTQIVTASGNVLLRHDDETVRADQVSYDRDSGKIVATGHIRMVSKDGNEILTDRVELTDEFTTGTMTNLLLLLREGGRLAGASGQRDAEGNYQVERAAYTSCDVVDARGCPQKPSWRVLARSVTYSPKGAMIQFRGARINLFGVLEIPLPKFKIATDGRSLSGFLIPDFRTSSTNGAEFAFPYYLDISPNRGLTLTPHVFTQANPMGQFQYRALTGAGAYQVSGYVTSSPVVAANGGAIGNGSQFRGYLDTSGRFQLSPEWSVSYSGRYTTDRTFLLRYYINSDDLLRSTFSVERVANRSYLSIAGWAFETLRSGERQGLVPIALPEIDWRFRPEVHPLGGTLELQANSLAITRSAGQDTQRAFASARWDLRHMTGLGQVVTLTTLARGDIYHSTGNSLTTTTSYQGLPGWQGRGVVLGAVDMIWPLVGPALGGTQVLTPHIQVVASPPTRNLALPNEDARAIELEDDNLFALNRFPGYDRIEDGVRFTYGFDWQLERPRWRVNSTIGQSYRLSTKPTLLPDGTGLSDRESDIVGRTEVRYRDFFKITHRFRLDKDSLAFRRNEIDATIGSERSYVELGYARLNRDINASLEDLQDSNEVRGAVRLAFARYWSVFGSGVFDLPGSSNTTTVNNVTTTTTTNSWQPLRTRVGLAYQSDCLTVDVTWRRDYITIGDATRGSSFQVRFALRNLGFH